MISKQHGHFKAYATLATIVYLLLVVYGTLFPLSGWQWQSGGLDVFLSVAWPERLTRTDVIVNLLIYIPLGYLICVVLNDDKPTKAMIFATAIGAALCILLEYLQTYLPNRVPSFVDVSLNTAGSMLGAALAVMTGRDTVFAHKILQYKSQWFVDQPLTNLALLSMLFWSLSQLTPLVPSPDIYNLRFGAKLIYHTILSPSTFEVKQAMFYFLNISALGLLMSIFLNADQGLLKKMGIFITAVLLLKIPIIDRQLSLEAITGAFAAVVVSAFFANNNSKLQAFVATCLLLVSYTVSGLATTNESDIVQNSMNWTPFAPQMGSIFGLVDIVLSIWPFMALACLMLVISPTGSFMLGLFCIAVIFSLSFYIEWSQQYYADRYPDITDVLLAVSSFTVCYWQYRKFSYYRPNYHYQPVGKLIE